MTVKKKKSTKPINRKKRVLKFFGIIFIIPILLLLVMSVVALLPQQKTGIWISERISALTGFTVEMDEVGINLFGRIHLKGISAISQDGDTLVTLERIMLNYKFLPLLKRQLAVRKIEIVSPAVYLSPSLLSDLTALAPPKEKDSQPQPLPMTFGLLDLNLSSFDLQLCLPDTSPVQKIDISGVCLRAENLFVPRGELSPERPSSGKINLYTEDGSIGITDSSGSYNRSFDLDLAIEKDLKGVWQADAKAGIGTLENKSIIEIILACSGKFPDLKADIRKMSLRAVDKNVLDISGTITPNSDGIDLDLSMDSERLSVKKFVLDLLPLVPPNIPTELDTSLLQGWIKPLQGRITGSMDSLVFSTRTRIAADSFSFEQEGLTLDQIKGTITSSGLFYQNSLSRADVVLNLSLSQVSAAVDDSTVVKVGPFELNLESRIDSSLLPVQGKFSASIDSLFEGRAGVNLSWVLPASRLHEVTLGGKVFAEELEIAALPAIPAGIEGQIALNSDISITALSDIFVEVDLRSDGITYILNDRLEKTDSLLIFAGLQTSTDTTFTVWDLHSLTAQLNPLLELFLTGTFNSKTMILSVPEFRGLVRNSLIKQFLPKSIRDDIIDLTVSGEEVVEGELRIDLSDPQTEITTKGRFHLINVSLVDDATAMILPEIDCDVNWQGTTNDLSGDLFFQLKNAEMSDVLPDPLDSLGISLDFRINQGVMDITDGALQVTQFGLSGGFRARIDSVDSSQHISADGGVRFEASRPLLLPGGMEANGMMTCRFACNSIDSLTGKLAFSGELFAEKVNVSMDTVMSLNNIVAKLPFDFTLDLLSTQLLADSSYIPIPWTDFESRSNLYRNLMPELGFLKVESADVLDYTLSDIELDVRLGNGWLEVPRLHTRFLGGNLGGMVRVNYSTGDLQNLSYEIMAQAARINSAALTADSAVVEEATELNCVLSFTGAGIDPAAGIDLEGFFNITRIGPKFASTLLKGMDPDEKDRSIRLTRRLLNMGWKPSLFSFEARHGYVYPSLSLVQPWFSPIRLPEKLEFGRLPLEFFLQSAGE